MNPSLALLAFLSTQVAAERPLLRIAGSSTVLPVAKRWAEALSSSFRFDDTSGEVATCTAQHVNGSDWAHATVCGGGSSTGAKRVCLERTDPEHVDIGDMSRDWKDKEAIRLDDGYTMECKSSKIRVTQMVVGVDGLAVVVNKAGPAANCLASLGGLTVAQLRWMFSDWTDDALSNDKDGGLSMESVAPNNDQNGVKEWSDLSADCEKVAINTYGPGALSGTSGFFGEVVFCEDCFARKDDFTPENFNNCASEHVEELEHTLDPAATAHHLLSERATNCYYWSEDDEKIREWVETDAKGIAYFGYAHYAQHAGQLGIVPIASDAKRGVADTADARIVPSTYTIIDGSYAVFTRSLFMNVDNEAWPKVKPFFSFGFGDEGQALVGDAGYVKINKALLAKMVRRTEEGGNVAADYVTLPPDNCPEGQALESAGYYNRFGNYKVNYTCAACGLGKFKGDDRAVPCFNCTEGTFAGASGLTQCKFCKPGQYAEIGVTSCSACPKNTAAGAPGSGACMPCDPGFFTEDVGQTACERCAIGMYKDEMDSECLRCPEGMTTEFRAAAHLSDCACAEGSFLSKGASSTGRCEECKEGLECPFGSAFDNFQQLAEEPGLTVPLVKVDHWTDPSEPLSVYQCRVGSDRCPGGAPGQCTGGSIGIVCALCPEGQAWSDGSCKRCADGLAAMRYFFVLILLVVIVAVYYLGNSPIRIKVTVATAASVLASQLVTVFQILSMFKDLNIQWPAHVQAVFTSFSVAMGSADAVSPECFLGQASTGRYIFRCSMPLMLLLLVALIFFASKVASLARPKIRAWDVDGSINALGQVLQAVFIGVAAIVVVPLQCYQHPNGKQSMSQYPEELCFDGSSNHTLLLAVGLLVGTLFVVPFLVYCWWGTYVVVNPSTTKETKSNLRRFRFLLFRFRSDVWWWGNVFMMRQLLLAFAPALPQDSPHSQSIYLVVVLSTYGFFQAHMWPWKSPEFNILDAYLTALLVAMISIAMAFIEKDPREGYGALLVISMITMALGLAMLLGRIALTLVRHRSVDNEYSVDAAQPNKELGSKLHNLIMQAAHLNLEEFLMRFEKLGYYDRLNATNGIAVFAQADQIKKRLPLSDDGFNSEESTASWRSRHSARRSETSAAKEKVEEVQLSDVVVVPKAELGDGDDDALSSL